jgi:hypothetical protein
MYKRVCTHISSFLLLDSVNSVLSEPNNKKSSGIFNDKFVKHVGNKFLIFKLFSCARLLSLAAIIVRSRPIGCERSLTLAAQMLGGGGGARRCMSIVECKVADLTIVKTEVSQHASFMIQVFSTGLH